MPEKEPIPVETLRQLLRYNPDTGELFWLERTPRLSASERARVIFNKRFAGASALTADDNHGYFCGTILGKSYKAHRVCWALYYGQWPDGHIDHINHIRSDNRIINLRTIAQSDNQKNLKKSKANTSGVTGVYWDGWTYQWVVRFMVNGSNRNLGRFDRFEDAVIVRKKAEMEHGYHKNHGC